MTPIFADLTSAAIVAFHDQAVAGPPPAVPAHAIDRAWDWVAVDHRCNVALWNEEDQARRIDVGSDAIAANKRAIDRFNQERNDAIEKIDEALLARIAAVPIAHDAWHNSETAGAMIDRLSILALKIFHMRAQTVRVDVSPAHIESCIEKLRRLEAQRGDLARCLNALLSLAADGRAFWRVYRQFKMYNSPQLNPYLYARKP